MSRYGTIYWRREWDSNPRYSHPYSGFQDRRLRPLGHPSTPYSISEPSPLSPPSRCIQPVIQASTPSFPRRRVPRNASTQRGPVRPEPVLRLSKEERTAGAKDPGPTPAPNLSFRGAGDEESKTPSPQPRLKDSSTAPLEPATTAVHDHSGFRLGGLQRGRPFVLRLSKGERTASVLSPPPKPPWPPLTALSRNQHPRA